MNYIFACVLPFPACDPSSIELYSVFEALPTSNTSTCTEDDLRVVIPGCYATSSFEKWGVVTNHIQRAAAYRQDRKRFPAMLRKQARKGRPGRCLLGKRGQGTI
jgi:hypothetical protein